MENEDKFYRVYGKGPKMGTYKAMDYNEGAFVGNLIYATIFTQEQAGILKERLQRLAELNAGFKFQIRDTHNKVVFEV